MANKLNLNLSGGMNVRAASLIIKDNESELILNYNLDTIGALTKRNGMGLLGGRNVHNTNVNGLYQFNDQSTNTSIPLMVENNSTPTAATIYYMTGGNWAASDRTTETPSKKTRFSSFVDYAFRVNASQAVITSANGANWSTTNAPITQTNQLNGAINNTDVTITVDSTDGFLFNNGLYTFKIDSEIITATGKTATTFTGATRGTHSTSAASHSDNAIVTDQNFITPSYTSVFQDRVYFANGVTVNMSRLWFSSLPDTGVVTWDVENDWIDINPDDGDSITALENNGNRLLIFKTRSLYRWTFGQVEPDRLIGVGTQSQESVKTNFDVGITFFANQFGIYAYTTGRPKLLSRKIQKYINAVTDWTSVFGEVDNDHYYLSVGNITVDGRTYTNAQFVYNIPLDAWSIFTMGCPAITFMARLQPPANATSFVAVGTADGRTYQFSVSNSLVDIEDAGSGITLVAVPAEFRSKEYLLSFPNRTNFTWLDVFSQLRQEAAVFYDLDRQNDFTELNVLQDRISNFRIPDRECNSVRIKVADPGTPSGTVSSLSQQMIEGFNIEHNPKEKRDEMPSNRLRRRKNNG